MTATQDPRYLKIVEHYERCLAEHGDCAQGVGWPKAKDTDTRYRVMLDVVPPDAGDVTLLDFGCGVAHLYDYLQRRRDPRIAYVGLDLSPAMVEFARTKHPDVEFLCGDLLAGDLELPQVDYAVLNGLLTMRAPLGEDEMWDYTRALLRALFPRVRRGLAFNVQTKQVDWERDDLFHVPMDQLASFLVSDLSRHFSFRHDYGLYEYTAYVYHQPRRDDAG